MAARRYERRKPDLDPACGDCALAGCLVQRHFEGFFGAAIAADFDMVTASRGARIVSSEDGSAALGIVVEGMVMLEGSLPDGRRQVIGFCTAGDVLAPTAPCEALACEMVALAATRLCRLRPLNGGWPARLTETLLDTARARLASAERHLLLLARLSARERVASFLLEMAARIGRPRAAGLCVDLPMNREVIGDYLGLNAETVSRQFTGLKGVGAIDLPRPGLVVIADRGRLAAETPLSRFAAPWFSAVQAAPCGPRRPAPVQMAGAG